MANAHPQFGEILGKTLTLTPEAEALLKQGINEYLEEFKSQAKA